MPYLRPTRGRVPARTTPLETRRAWDSDWLKPDVRLGREFRQNWIARLHLARGEYDRNHAGLDYIPELVASNKRRHQTRPEHVQLRTRIPQARYFDQSHITQMQPRPGRDASCQAPRR